MTKCSYHTFDMFEIMAIEGAKINKLTYEIA